MFDNIRHPHFIGIGGSGISALAFMALTEGLKVTGSDVSQNPTTERLIKEGAVVHSGHQKEHLPDESDAVIYSEAIDQTKNPEYLEAKKRGLPSWSYFQALGKLSVNKKTIVVAGTHGKTTTTAMLGQALMTAGEDPTVIVGSRVPAFGDLNVRLGKSDWLVAEGCEYRRSFLSFEPFGVVLLNCELEHVDYYKGEEDYLAAFVELVSKIPEEGFLVYNADDKNCQKIKGICLGKAIGVSAEALEPLNLKVPGNFNQFNANEAYQAALQVTQNEKDARSGLESFGGTARRMEVKGEKNDVLVIDDYGHHPTEVRATLEALKQAYPNRRLICVFQPHQYSRTHELLDQFVGAFESADQILIPNIFEARDTEEDKRQISAEKLVSAISAQHPNVKWTENFEKTIDVLQKEVRDGDLIVTMGAGDIYKVGEMYLRAFLKRP